MELFGADGYLVFFGVLEIYSREFKTELDWNLTITRAYLRQKLHKRQDTLVIKILKHIQNSGKWNIEINDTQVIIFIPKFTELIDEWSRRKRRSDSVVTPKILSADKEEEEDKDKEEDNTWGKPPKAPRKVFQIPTMEEIKSYCTERKNKIDAQYFLDYQNARDWILKGGQKVKDWKAVIRTWERNNINTGANNAGTNTNRGNGNQKLYSEQDRLADEINAEYYRRKAIETADNPTGNT